MKFRLVYTHRAVKDIDGLTSQSRERIREALDRFSDSPTTHAKKMVDPALGTYRFRIGDYRVIFDLEGNDIVVLRVGHRRDIYRRL